MYVVTAMKNVTDIWLLADNNVVNMRRRKSLRWGSQQGKEHQVHGGLVRVEFHPDFGGEIRYGWELWPDLSSGQRQVSGKTTCC